jgi:hypothetical protein
VTVEIINCEQGTPEWFSARLGIPTASEFATVMAKGKDGGASVTRLTYMRKLAGEILTGEPMENYTNQHMERGRLMEDEARDLYSFMTDADPIRVGFIRNGNKGCSPDSLIGVNCGLEIKSALPHIQIERLQRGDLPPEHKAQVQGCMWVCERDYWDFVSYGGAKLPLFVHRVTRDNGYIATLAGAVDRFNDELAALVEHIRRYGQKAEAA